MSLLSLQKNKSQKPTNEARRESGSKQRKVGLHTGDSAIVTSVCGIP